MKKAAVVRICFVVILLLTISLPTTHASGETLSLGSITFSVPDGWLIKNNDQYGGVITISTLLGLKTIELTGMSDNGVTLNDLPDLFASISTSTLEINTMDKDCKINGLPYLYMDYHDPGNFTYGKIAIFHDEQDQVMYAFTMSSVSQFSDDDNSTWDALLSSISCPSIQMNELRKSTNSENTEDINEPATDVAAEQAAEQNSEYRVLQNGDKGDDVKHLKHRLIELGYMTGAWTSLFDPSTTAAVELFQKTVGLPVTGIADEKTQEVLYTLTIYAPIQEASSATVEDSTPEPTHEPKLEPTATPEPAPASLARDDTGKDVVKLQKRLIMLGYLSKVKADGIFGSEEESAVKRFQKVNGLESTGIADPDTLNAIYSTVAAKAPSYTTLRRGDKSDQVKNLQQQLIELGWLNGNADGDFGAKTEDAVKRFQEAIGLQKTGVADENMQRWLYSDEAPIIGSDGSIIQNIDFGSRVEAVAVGSETKGLSYEVVDKGFEYWTNSIGGNEVFAFIAIKNTDTRNIYLDSCHFDYEDVYGHLLDTNDWISSCPDVIAPGEVGYFYASGVNGGYLNDTVNTSQEIKLVAQFALEPARESVQSYEVLDDSLAFENTLGTVAPVIRGRVRNNTTEDEGLLYINVVFKDKTGKVIAISGTTITDLFAGSTLGFEISMRFNDTPRLKQENIGSYEIIASPTYYQF